MRALCPDCRRPFHAWIPREGTEEKIAVEGACYCPRITSLATKTRVVLLQHPRERHMAIGTARMARLALPNARLAVGVRFSDDPEIVAAHARNEAFVLFPGPGSLPVEALPTDRAITLVVVDGTWSQAKKILKANPLLRALPRIGFTPRRPSGYLIRKEPSEECVSTIEALAEVLRTLEPDGDRFERLLDPFHAMVARQRWFESTVAASRHRNALRKPKVSPRVVLAERLAAFGDRLVCIHGEANSWPHTAPDRPAPELVQWIAHRPATNETFHAIVRPRHALGSLTCEHIELGADRLSEGTTIDACHEGWRAFIRPDDVLVLWGTFYRDLAVREGLLLANESIDLRDEASRIFKRKMGTLDKATETVGSTSAQLELPGRGGRRLNALVGALAELGASAPIEI